MSNTKTEVKLWLEKALVKENLKNITVEIQGNSEKGDGYMGDIVFVNAKGTDITNNKEKSLNLVLKCSKKSQSLRDSMPIKDAFENEILIYDAIIPEFQKFQRLKSIEKVFNSVPKYYGHFTNETTEIIVLENLKKIGYDLWDQKKPLTKQHLLMVIEQYGVFHGISGAMQIQNPEKFYEFGEQLGNIMKKFSETTDIEKMIGGAILEVHDLIKNSVGDEILKKLVDFKSQLRYVYTDMITECKEDFRVISHGDCWNNNFLWKHNEDNKTIPEKVAILDWQISSLVSPVLDLSYFIFSCISKDDLKDFNTILDTYYNSFSKTLKQLGNNAEDLYSKEKLLSDWQKYARYGFGFSMLVTKLGFAKKENLPDMAKSADEGKDIAEIFMFNVSDNKGYQNRIQPVVEFVVKNKLID